MTAQSNPKTPHVLPSQGLAFHTLRVHGTYRESGSSSRNSGFALATAVVADHDARSIGTSLPATPDTRNLDDEHALETTGVVADPTRNRIADSPRAVWHAATALGYRRQLTYTYSAEAEAALRAAGRTKLRRQPPNRIARTRVRKRHRHIGRTAHIRQASESEARQSDRPGGA